MRACVVCMRVCVVCSMCVCCALVCVCACVCCACMCVCVCLAEPENIVCWCDWGDNWFLSILMRNCYNTVCIQSSASAHLSYALYAHCIL